MFTARKYSKRAISRAGKLGITAEKDIRSIFFSPHIQNQSTSVSVSGKCRLNLSLEKRVKGEIRFLLKCHELDQVERSKGLLTAI